jgi:hypothetical protein
MSHLGAQGHEVDGWLLPTGGPPGQRKTSANQAPNWYRVDGPDGINVPQ